MLRFSKDVTDAEIREAIRKWIDLLAADQYKEAHEMLFHFPDDQWTPALMQRIVLHYGSLEPRKDGKVFKVTPRTEALHSRLAGPYEDIDWFDDGSGVAHFDLPLNGEWSDLTAIIDIVTQGEDRVLRLNDLHVL